MLPSKVSETPDPEPNGGAPSGERRGDVTRALMSRAGDPAGALEEVLPLVYRELQDLASRALANGHPLTLQRTDLVHEAYLRLSKQESGWTDRPNLMLAAAFAMRRALVDHIRRRRSAKRGDGVRAIDDSAQIAVMDRRFDVLDLEDALGRLEEEDKEAAEVACLRLFGGLSNAEAAEGLSVSTRTIERRWRYARAWLVAELGQADAGPGHDRSGER
ncbi:MAG: ECF-type sigma factor [Planctomycetota bacterium]